MYSSLDDNYFFLFTVSEYWSKTKKTGWMKSTCAFGGYQGGYCGNGTGWYIVAPTRLIPMPRMRW